MKNEEDVIRRQEAAVEAGRELGRIVRAVQAQAPEDDPYWEYMEEELRGRKAKCK